MVPIYQFIVGGSQQVHLSRISFLPVPCQLSAGYVHFSAADTVSCCFMLAVTVSCMHLPRASPAS